MVTVACQSNTFQVIYRPVVLPSQALDTPCYQNPDKLCTFLICKCILVPPIGTLIRHLFI